MTKIFFFILLFVGANCSGLSINVFLEIINQMGKSTSELQSSVIKNMKYINDLHNQSSSNFKMFAHKLDVMQCKIERTEQIIDQTFTTISVDLQKLALDTDKLQYSVDQLSAFVAEINKNMKEEHNETASFLKALENKLNDIQETGKILYQKIVSNSEDHQKLRHQLNTILKVHLDDCLDLYNVGFNVSTSYFLPKYNREVLCDMKTDGGGWLVIQKRKKVTNQVDFNRDWDSYKEGFGDLDTEFWIGNEFLHRITNKKSYELRIEMEDFENGTFYATYSEFRVGNEDSGYQSHIGGYEGNAPESFLKFHNNKKFTTIDRDNDKKSDGNCAKTWSGGFWFDNCVGAHLNGVFPTVPDRKNGKLMRWWNNGEWLILINAKMMIRPKVKGDTDTRYM